MQRLPVSGLTLLLVQEVNRVSPGKPVWLGETSSAFGGGAAGLSDTFAAGFMWVFAHGGWSRPISSLSITSGLWLYWLSSESTVGTTTSAACRWRAPVCRWLDKLGLAASRGLQVVMRQVLVGAGSYHLIGDNLEPLPVRLPSLRTLLMGAQWHMVTIKPVESIHIIYWVINAAVLTSTFEKTW